MISLARSRSQFLFLFAILAIPVVASSQTWSDSLSKDDRFWSRSGGMSRELSLGAGGFGMLADSGIKTLTVNPFSVDPAFILQNPAYASRYPGYIWFDDGITGNTND